MKMLLSLALSAALLLSPALAAESGFSDVPDDAWYAPHVALCREKGLLTGTGDGRFTPQGVVNTDEALVMAARVLWQADGGVGPLPKGPSAEEFRSLMGEDAAMCAFAYDLETAQRYSALWSWDGLTYLAQRAKEEGASLSFLEEGVVYPTSRQNFFAAVAFAAKGLELPAINEIEAVPGTVDEGILALYRAGVLTGTDPHGSFDGQKGLTRAEAAATLARIAQPKLCKTFTPLPSPYQGYTLTYLADGRMSWGVTPWLCGVEEGFLTLTGELVPFPGNGPSSSLSPAGDYFHIGVYVEETQDPYDTYGNLLGADGKPVIPFGLYDDLFPSGDGFLAVNWQGNGQHEYLLLHGDGSPALALPPFGAGVQPVEGWRGISQGLLSCRDSATVLWGYVGLDGNWVAQPQWSSAGDFLGGYAVVQGGEERLWGLIDQTGRLVLPYEYEMLCLYQNSPGYKGGGLLSYQDREGNAGWVALDGTIYPKDKDIRSDGYRNGYAVCNPADYNVAGAFYLDLTAQRVSETFDWAGPIGADGAGFVGLDRKIYRIQFDPIAP